MLKQLNDKFKIFRNKLVNRETVVYIIAGVLTTAVNLLVYGFFCNVLGLYYLISNIIAWVIAVIFAYIINDLWVFKSQIQNMGSEIIKILKFFAARGFSLFVEEAGLFLFVNVMGWNNMLVKVFLAVVVIVLNYLFSKIYIFNKKKA